MGLAASQARFLGITARKSNIEYEGQQVNQQRTALAEEVNALYSKLLALDVPVAPDVTQYYEDDYSFSVANSAGYSGDYIVKSYFQNDDGTYHLNTERTYSTNAAQVKILAGSSITNSESKYILRTPEGEFELTLNSEENSKKIIDLINKTYGEGTIKDTQMYSYKDAKGEFQYLTKSMVEGYTEATQLEQYMSTNTTVTEPIVFDGATVTLDSNGRFSSITAVDQSGAELFNATKINTTKIYNSDDYDSALRDYTMSKEEYDKAIADLNAQTESLQQEDKVLELRLNQIDTEQNELQTELEAVKAILDKNIENTFKTFA